jgi:hypothetical protein
VKVGDLNQNLNHNGMVGCITVETQQGTQGVCTDQTTLLRLTLDEQSNSVHSIELHSENDIKIMEAIGKYLAITYESIPVDPTNILHHVVQVGHTIFQGGIRESLMGSCCVLTCTC